MLELEAIDIKRTGIIVYLHFSAGCVQPVLLRIYVSHQLISSLCQLPWGAPQQQLCPELPSSCGHLPRPLPTDATLSSHFSPGEHFSFLTISCSYFSMDHQWLCRSTQRCFLLFFLFPPFFVLNCCGLGALFSGYHNVSEHSSAKIFPRNCVGSAVACTFNKE